MEDTVLGLSILELHLFVAVLHLYGRKLQGSASAGGSGGGAGAGVASSGSATAGRVGDAEVTMMVNQVLKVCDMLVEMKKQKVRLRQVPLEFQYSSVYFSATNRRRCLPCGPSRRCAIWLKRV